MSNGEIKVYIDGSCGPYNPGGKMGWGVYFTYGESLFGRVPASRDNSNNVAEYLALIEAFKHVLKQDLSEGGLTVHSDSKLLVKQMQGFWKAKGGRYITQLEEARALAEELGKVLRIKYRWIPREKNKIADWLSKK